MRDKSTSRLLHGCRIGLSAIAIAQWSLSPALAIKAQSPGDSHTATPIKHVIVIIGENRSFDHVFATYVPKQSGVSVSNLLSQGIIALDASNNAIPGPNFQKAHQLAAQDLGSNDAFLLSPPKQLFPNDQLPSPLVGGPKVSYIPNECGGGTPITQCAASLALAQQTEIRIGVGLLFISFKRRHQPNIENAGSAHHQRQYSAGWTVSAYR